jgi:hypothetical protein
VSPSTPTPDVNDSPDGVDPAAAPEPGTPVDPSVARSATPEQDDANEGVRGEEVEIESVVDPSTIRRAPKYKAFFLTGAVVGLLAGFVIWVVWMGSPASGGVLKPGVYLTVLVLGTTTLTTLVAGALALWADKRSLRR